MGAAAGSGDMGEGNQGGTPTVSTTTTIIKAKLDFIY